MTNKRKKVNRMQIVLEFMLSDNGDLFISERGRLNEYGEKAIRQALADRPLHGIFPTFRFWLDEKGYRP